MKLLSSMIAAAFLMFCSVTLTYADEKVKDDSCLEKKVQGYGFPKRMKSVANMNAIIQWINETKKKHGTEYAQWHTAKESKVTCRQSGVLHTCYAEASPCKQRAASGKKATNTAKAK